VWSSELSFASPEADFTFQQARTMATLSEANKHSEWTGHLSFASPESDFVSENVVSEVESVYLDRSHKNEWSGMLSFASPESDWCAEVIMPKSVPHELPKTFEEVLLREDDAIIVTTASAPHSIVHVNHAWEVLCGYSKKDVLNKTLSVIQGRDTNTELAERTVDRLVKTKNPQDMYLINYKKSGEAFTNHVSLGYLKLNNETPDVEFLVGILQQVRPHDVPLRMAA
jgi:PAS domain S-box-containing protein